MNRRKLSFPVTANVDCASLGYVTVSGTEREKRLKASRGHGDFNINNQNISSHKGRSSHCSFGYSASHMLLRVFLMSLYLQCVALHFVLKFLLFKTQGFGN
jgi:hypothetical protein